MAQTALGIVQHTPWWVFGLFALLLGLGLQAARPRRTKLRRMLITPFVFVGWGLAGLAQQAIMGPLAGPAPLAAWLAAAALGTLLGLATARLDGVQIDRARGIVGMPGSWLPLVRNLAIFAARYGLAVASALTPAAHGRLMLWDLAVAGLGTGYFVGWLVVFAQQYRRAAPQNAVALSEGARS
jgi:hypothetical protein